MYDEINVEANFTLGQSFSLFTVEANFCLVDPYCHFSS